jgi:hypothetical protein
LPKLIDDKKVPTKEVRAFLAQDFPKDSLPSVDEARALAEFLDRLSRHPVNPVSPKPEMASAFYLGHPQRRMQRDFIPFL